MWGLPKGHREKNETYATCANREVLEETGLDIKLRDNMPKIKIKNTYYFPVKINEHVTLTPRDKVEIKKAAWISVKSIKSIILNHEAKIMLTKKLTEAKQIIKLIYKYDPSIILTTMKKSKPISEQLFRPLKAK